MPIPILPISATPGPRLVPKAGADGKLLAGWIPDLSGTYQPLNATLTTLSGKAFQGSGDIVLATAPTLTNPVITGGSINNTPIGGTTPSTIAGTTGTFSGNVTGATVYATNNLRVDVGLRDNRDNAIIAQSGSGVISNRTLTLANATYSNLEARPDADFTTILGRARIDSRITDIAYFSHVDQTGNNSSALRQNALGGTVLNAASGQSVDVTINNTIVASYLTGGIFVFQPQVNRITDAGTATAINPITVLHRSSGVPTTNFGVGILLQGHSSTNTDRDMARIRSTWTTATDASRVSNLILSTWNIGVETDVLTLTPTSVNSAVKLSLFGGDSSGALFQVKGNGQSQMRLIASSSSSLNADFLVTNSGSNGVIFAIDPTTGDGSSLAMVRYFRNTNTSGRASMNIQVPNSATVNTSLAGNGDSYLNNNSGNVTIGGDTNPDSNKLNVVGTVQADGLRLDLTPTAETITPTHTITISVNGTNYKIPLQAA